MDQVSGFCMALEAPLICESDLGQRSHQSPLALPVPYLHHLALRSRRSARRSHRHPMATVLSHLYSMTQQILSIKQSMPKIEARQLRSVSSTDQSSSMSNNFFSDNDRSISRTFNETSRDRLVPCLVDPAMKDEDLPPRESHSFLREDRRRRHEHVPARHKVIDLVSSLEPVQAQEGATDAQ